MHRHLVVSLLCLLITGCTGLNIGGSSMDAAICENNRGCDYEEQGNYSAALECYQKSASRGFFGGKYNLARCYYWGVGLPQNPGYAVQLAQEAAQHGYAPAQYIVGHALFYGNGVPQDQQNGMAWLRAAANHGNIDARVLLDQIGRAQWQQYLQQLSIQANQYRLQQQNAPAPVYSPTQIEPKRPAARSVPRVQKHVPSTRAPEHIPSPIDVPDKL